MKETVWAAVTRLRSDLPLDAEKTTPIEAVSLLDFPERFCKESGMRVLVGQQRQHELNRATVSKGRCSSHPLAPTIPTRRRYCYKPVVQHQCSCSIPHIIHRDRGNHPILKLLENYPDTTLWRGKARLIHYRLCTKWTFSAVSFSGGFSIHTGSHRRITHPQRPARFRYSTTGPASENGAVKLLCPALWMCIWPAVCVSRPLTLNHSTWYMPGCNRTVNGSGVSSG